VRDDPAARAHEARDPAQGPYRVGLMHQERPREREVERPAQRLRVKLVNITGDERHVLQSECRHDRPGVLDGRLAEVNADHPAGRPHHLRQDGQPADGAAPAVDHRPPRADAHPAQCTPGVLRKGLRQAQQPPQVVIAAVQDVTPDLVRRRICHARPRCLVGVSSRAAGSRNVPDVDS
jgi:hypothetical protein